MHTTRRIRTLLPAGALALAVAAACASQTSQLAPDDYEEGVDTTVAILSTSGPEGAPKCPPGTGRWSRMKVRKKRASLAVPTRARRRAQIDFPANPRRPATWVWIKEPAGDSLASVELTADSVVGPTTLRLSYAGCTKLEAVQRSGPAVYRWEGTDEQGVRDGWRKIGGRQIDSTTVEVRLDSFSRYAVGAN